MQNDTDTGNQYGDFLHNGMKHLSHNPAVLLLGIQPQRKNKQKYRGSLCVYAEGYVRFVAV